MSFEILINNSYCLISGNIPQDVYLQIEELLSYEVDIEHDKTIIFKNMRIAKSKGNNKYYHKLINDLKKLQENEKVCWFKDNRFPTGHLNMVLELLNDQKVDYLIKDLREIPSPNLILRWNNEPPELRYYQKEAVAAALEAKRGVLEMSVGSGKTFCLLHLIKTLKVNTLIIEPTLGLVNQVGSELELYLGSKNIEYITTDKIKREKKLKPIRIVTIQTLASLQKKGLIQNVVSDINMVLIDEFHHGGSTSFTNLLPEIDHIYYRFGCSGTFLRNGEDVLDLWGFLSNKIYSYPAFKAIKEGYLTKVKFIVHDLKGISNGNYQKEYNYNYCGGKELLNKIQDIIQNSDDKAQILILVSRKEKSGVVIEEFLRKSEIESTFISGDDSGEEIGRAIENFNKKKIRILIGSSVLGEGIDVKSTQILIMAMGQKSEILIVQAVGRCVRLYPDKESAEVHDFNFKNTNYLKKHMKIRQNIYKRHFEE